MIFPAEAVTLHNTILTKNAAGTGSTNNLCGSITSASSGSLFGPLPIAYAKGTADEAVVRVLERDAYGNPTRVSDPEERETEYVYDALDRLASVTLQDPDGAGGQKTPVTEYVYTATGRLEELIETSVESPNAKIVTRYEYDNRRRLADVYADSGGDDEVHAQYEYDAAGNLTAVIDPLGRTTTYAYDLADRLIRVTEPDPDDGGAQAAPQTMLAYDALGRIAATVDPRGTTTRYEYDHHHRLARVAAAHGAGEEYQYDDAGQLVAMIDAAGRTTRYDYDDLGRVTAVRPPGQDAAPLAYQYDTLGNLRVAADQLGREAKYEYDRLRRVVKEIDQNGDATIFDYDALGRLVTLIDPEFNATTWAYNAAGQLESVTNELVQTRSYLYDEFHRLAQLTDRNGRVTTYQYDNLHRLRTEKWYADQSHLNSSPGSPLHAISFDFDDAGQLTGASDAFAEYDYDYDDLGRATKVIASLAGLTPEITFDREYDSLRLTASGARIGTTAGEGGTADYRNDYQFDRLGRATQIVQSANGGHAVAAKRVDLGYDRLSRFTSVERYASVDASAPVVDTSFSYDLIGRITEIDHAGVVAHGYEWDASNRLTRYVNSVDGAVDYAYDQRGQLAGVDYVGNWQTDESYQYDDNGNRELVTNDAGADQDYEAGGDNRLAGDGAFAYEYDAEGNRIARFIDNDSNGFLSTGDADVTQYEWDHRNRLAKVIERASHGGTIAKQVDHVYDAFDRHIKRTVDPDGATGGDPIEQTFFPYDQGQIVLQFDKTGAGAVAAGDLSHRYAWGPAVDMLLADEQVDWSDMDADGDVLWALADHLGSVRDVVDSAGTPRIHRQFDGFGNILDAAHYDAGGQPVASGQAGFVDVAFAYTGRFLDGSAGLQQNGRRWYDAAK